MIKKSIAFTLAESLLVMTVIGIIATLVVPNLKNNSDDQVYVAKARKVYAELETAYERATLKYGNSRTWSVGQFYTRMGEFLNVKKHCTENDDSCKSQAGCTKNYLILNDNSSFCISASNVAEYSQKYLGKPRGVFIDLDGPSKGPNTIKKDIFIMSIIRSADETIPAVMIDYFPIRESVEESLEAGESPTTMTVLRWMLEYGNMDFNHCDVKWETKTSCK